MEKPKKRIGRIFCFWLFASGFSANALEEQQAARSQKPEARSQKPEARSQKPKAKSTLKQLYLMSTEICVICQRALGNENNISKHHLIPKSEGGRHPMVD